MGELSELALPPLVVQEFVLVDAGALGAAGSNEAAAFSHHLDSLERLVACYRLLRQGCPQARVLVFLQGSGYSQLCEEWQRGGAQAQDLERSDAQCVPFGCRVNDFLLALARQRAAEGCRVQVVSNAADIVMGIRNAGPRLVHWGFMFVEDELLLPGISCSRLRPGAPKRLPLRRTISKLQVGGRSGAQGRPGLAKGARPAESQETLHDSQLDGVALEEDSIAMADTQVDELVDEATFPDTCIDFPLPKPVAAPEFDAAVAFADTLVDFDLEMALSGHPSRSSCLQHGGSEAAATASQEAPIGGVISRPTAEAASDESRAPVPALPVSPTKVVPHTPTPPSWPAPSLQETFATPPTSPEIIGGSP